MADKLNHTTCTGLKVYLKITEAEEMDIIRGFVDVAKTQLTKRDKDILETWLLARFIGEGCDLTEPMMKNLDKMLRDRCLEPLRIEFDGRAMRGPDSFGLPASRRRQAALNRLIDAEQAIAAQENGSVPPWEAAGPVTPRVDPDDDVWEIVIPQQVITVQRRRDGRGDPLQAP
jgi:hypothetical protein